MARYKTTSALNYRCLLEDNRKKVMDLLIRDYTPTDYYNLSCLLAKVYGSHIGKDTLEEKYITDEREILVAAIDGDKIVGCVFTEVQEDFIRPRRVMYVTYVAVDEAYRKLGIGRKLMGRIENMCIEKDCSAIELTSADFRTGAHAFYESIGFSKKKTTVFIKEL